MRRIVLSLLAALMFLPGGVAQESPETAEGEAPGQETQGTPAEAPAGPDGPAAEPDPDPVELVLGIVARSLDGQRPVCWKDYPSAPGIPVFEGLEIVAWSRPVPNTSGEPCQPTEEGSE